MDMYIHVHTYAHIPLRKSGNRRNLGLGRRGTGPREKQEERGHFISHFYLYVVVFNIFLQMYYFSFFKVNSWVKNNLCQAH